MTFMRLSDFPRIFTVVSRPASSRARKTTKPAALCAVFFCCLWFAFAVSAHSQGVGDWAWMNGSSVNNDWGQIGVYGTMGTFAPGNAPPSRWGASTWTDTSGNLWMFGGYGLDTNDAASGLNDLWEYNPSTNDWAWIGGSIGSGAVNGLTGVYGTLGTPAAGNIPGTRYGAASWTDHSGSFWLFGGSGYDGVGGTGWLNDLWEFSPTTKEWTWISGSDVASPGGVYGTQGVAAAGNVPGGRDGASSWIDKSGNLWLFGGMGYGSAAGSLGWLNDLWEFNPTTKEWTWVSGGSAIGQSGVYGTLGTAAAGNVPGSREWAGSWMDTSGNLWLFAGGPNNIGPNDLWKFSPTSKEWAWMGGSGSNDQSGVYGTMGTAAAGNVPGSRIQSLSWTDGSGNFWLYGGYGESSTGTSGTLGDLWKFSPSSNEWTWVDGSSASAPAAEYGIFGALAAGNIPGEREGAAGWLDSSGNLWLFGGDDDPNDLWKYQLSTATVTATATPVFSLAGGTYKTVESVTISDATSGATIYYSTNATAAAPVWTPYSGAISVSATETIEAVAMASGHATSAAAGVSYTITLPAAATPTFSLASGTYSTTQTVTISDATAGATIYYTTNGTTPTTASTVYTGAISVTSSETIEAIAVAPGYSSSAVASATYTLTALPTTVTLTSSANPSNVSEYVTFTAIVTGAGSVVPTGTVQFSVNGVATGSPVALSGSTASYTTAALFAGASSIAAAYIPSSGSSFAASTSAALTQSVNGNCAGNTITTIASSVNPSGSGQAVTFTATVAAGAIPACVIGTPVTGGTDAPAGLYGTVQFTVNGVAAGSPITISGGAATSVAATYTTATLATGTDTIGAVFTEGNGFFASSTATTLSQVVTQTYTVTATPASVAVPELGKATTVIAVTGVTPGQFADGVTFQATNLPNGVTASFGLTSATETSVLTLSAGSTAAIGTYTVTVSALGNLSSTLLVLLGSVNIAVTVTGETPTCTIDYVIQPQNTSQFGATITIVNTGATALTGWTLSWTFANGQTVSQLWNGVETQSGANVTVTNESYNGSIAAGASYSGVGFNGTWNGVTNAVPAAISLNGMACVVN